jgi:hypothetical protein
LVFEFWFILFHFGLNIISAIDGRFLGLDSLCFILIFEFWVFELWFTLFHIVFWVELVIPWVVIHFVSYCILGFDSLCFILIFEFWVFDFWFTLFHNELLQFHYDW